MANEKFWLTKSLFEMTQSEWESVCDGCAKCCLYQLEDEKSGQMVYTNVVCDLLDVESCRCSDYDNRTERVPTCMKMSADNVQECAEFAPNSCAYRLLLEGSELPDWHHLHIGASQPRAGHEHSVAKRNVIAASLVDESELEDYVTNGDLDQA